MCKLYKMYFGNITMLKIRWAPAVRASTGERCWKWRVYQLIVRFRHCTRMRTWSWRSWPTCCTCHTQLARHRFSTLQPHTWTHPPGSSRQSSTSSSLTWKQTRPAWAPSTSASLCWMYGHLFAYRQSLFHHQTPINCNLDSHIYIYGDEKGIEL